MPEAARHRSRVSTLILYQAFGTQRHFERLPKFAILLPVVGCLDPHRSLIEQEVRSLNIPVNQLRRALHALFPGRGDSAQRSSTVLVVDDEPLIVQGLAAILNSEGFTVLTAFDAQSALKLVQKTSPQLLISDVNMPGMDGIELAMRLVTALPSMKVLLFSGDFASLKVNFTHQEEHHFSLLSKPVHPQQMLEQVRATLGGVQPGGPPQPHNNSAGNEGVLVGNRPRTSRRASPLPPPAEPTKIETDDLDPQLHPLDVRLNARRYFLKTAEGRAPIPPSRTHRPSFSERSALPRMSRGIPATKPSLWHPPAGR